MDGNDPPRWGLKWLQLYHIFLAMGTLRGPPLLEKNSFKGASSHPTEILMLHCHSPEKKTIVVGAFQTAQISVKTPQAKGAVLRHTHAAQTIVIHYHNGRTPLTPVP